MRLTVKEVDGRLLVVGELDDGAFYIVKNVNDEILIEGLGSDYWKAEIKFLFKKAKE